MADANKATEVLDREFLPLRGRLIEVAAALDRVDRAGGACVDPRMDQIRKTLELLAGPRPTPDRAEQVQLIFSLPYDPAWRK